jgi:poly(3-hydroxybutyrate) depolymerase
MPTLHYGAPCSQTEAPYIGQCNYDGAGTALAQIYGTLAPAATSLGGTFVTLDQRQFLQDPASHSLADTGYAYVPASCAARETCRIHVAFHGCLQESSGASGSDFYEHAGYNEWADTNHIIVLYPQTIVAAGSETNPNACWDWWGYDSADYANKNGPQMQAVRAMVAYFAGG